MMHRKQQGSLERFHTLELASVFRQRYKIDSQTDTEERPLSAQRLLL
jgi:hypothetical protein